MLKDVPTSEIMELIKHIKSNCLIQFEWIYKILLKELYTRQPYIARLYMYRDVFGENDM